MHVRTHLLDLALKKSGILAMEYDMILLLITANSDRLLKHCAQCAFQVCNESYLRKNTCGAE
jgi:hypothetical protein